MTTTLTIAIMLALLAAVAVTLYAYRPTPSERVARRRFAAAGGTILTRAVATAIDLTADLARMTGDELNAHAAELAQRIGAPVDGDDVPALVARATAVVERINAYNSERAQADAARAALTGARAAGATRVPVNQPPTDNRDTGEEDTPELVGPAAVARAIVSDPGFQAFRAHPTGKLTVEVPGEVRALFATANYPSQNTRVPGVQQPNRDTPLTILDLIDRQNISTNTVEWVQEVTAPTGAVEVTEGSAKPESTFSLELKSDSAATIAHWVNITRQALEDETQLQGYVQGRLTFGLFKRLNGQVLNGNGTAPNLRGILQTSGIGAYVSAAGESPVIAIRKAKTVAALSEYAPDAVVLNPTDWEAVELDTDDQGAFRVVTSVATGGTPRLWGLAVVETTNITAATFLVGAFREGATLWERTGVNIYITDSHASNFTSNILTLLVEMRAALSVWRPKAFVKGTLTPAA